MSVEKPPDAGLLPSFSVVVPTRRRPRQLAACLAALGALEYPAQRLEVVVVDDDDERGESESRLRGIAGGLDLKLVRAGGRGPAAARNVGAACAEGDLIAFTDDDCLPSPAWLRAFAARLGPAPERVVGGCTRNALAGNRYSRASQYIASFAYAFYNDDPGHARFFASNNLAMSSAVLAALGGFDPALRTCEDRDLCDRVIEHGYAMTYVPAAVVRHAHRLDLAGFWRQHFGYGRGAWELRRRRLRRRPAGRPDESGFHRRLAACAWEERHAPGWAALVALLALWRAANAAGFGYQALIHVTQRRRLSSPASPR